MYLGLLDDLPWWPLVRLLTGATGSMVFSKTGATEVDQTGFKATTAATTSASNVNLLMGRGESLEKSLQNSKAVEVIFLKHSRRSGPWQPHHRTSDGVCGAELGKLIS